MNKAKGLFSIKGFLLDHNSKHETIFSNKLTREVVRFYHKDKYYECYNYITNENIKIGIKLHNAITYFVENCLGKNIETQSGNTRNGGV